LKHPPPPSCIPFSSSSTEPVPFPTTIAIMCRRCQVCQSIGGIEGLCQPCTCAHVYVHRSCFIQTIPQTMKEPPTCTDCHFTYRLDPQGVWGIRCTLAWKLILIVVSLVCLPTLLFLTYVHPTWKKGDARGPWSTPHIESVRNCTS
jgi:hypothetical protein